jgi:hypothetical protein
VNAARIVDCRKPAITTCLSRRVARELGSRDQAVRPALGEEFAVAAALDDLAVVDHADLVGLGDRRQAIGDDDGLAAFAQGVQRLLDRLLGFGIEGGGHLVEQDDRRILRNAHALQRRWSGCLEFWA